MKRVHMIADVNTKNWSLHNIAPVPQPPEMSDEDPVLESDLDAEVARKREMAVDVGFGHHCFEDEHTIDEYIDLLKEENKKLTKVGWFHKEWFQSFVAILTQGGYIVKQRSLDGKIIYEQMDKKHLCQRLETTALSVGGKKRLASRFLDEPDVCGVLKRFHHVDFCSPDPTAFNLWRGYAVDPTEIPEVDMTLIQPFLSHMREVICGGNEEYFHQELMKNAWMFQNPNDHLQWATVLIGEEGTGKNTFYTDVLCSLWGDDWTEPNITNMDTITDDRHKDTLAFKKLIIANEVQDIERGHTSFDVLKSRITDHTYKLRNLFEQYVTVRNVNNYIFCTNNYRSIRLGQQDRRYFILEVSDIHIQDLEYFTALFATFTDEFRAHLLRYFLDYDLSEFNHRTPPLTELKEELQDEQKPLSQEFIEQLEFPEDGLSYDDLWNRFIEYCDANAVDHKFVGKKLSFGRQIKKFVDQGFAHPGGKTTRVYHPRGFVAHEPASAPILLKVEPEENIPETPAPQGTVVTKSGRVRRV
jgi:hypothetical protein